MDHSLVFVNTAPTPAAEAVLVNTSAPPPATAAATTAPIALFLPLILRRWVLIACLPSLLVMGDSMRPVDEGVGAAAR
ncbi:hypothetical protein GCM10009535_25880 [Streptomyces thermocarboxydovorans]|uniref:Uncharacterized protein n=1 Tax=Streptomyces thermocarboxydovorans TaxID=59298 RepID=A0ABN1HGG0_9ACTN